MAAIPLVAIGTPTGTTGSDGLAVFTFAADIDTSNHQIFVDRLIQRDGADYTVTGARQVTFVAPNIPLLGAAIWLYNGVSGITIGTSLPAWDTVAEIVSDAAIELGLRSTAMSDPFASTDPNILQLIALLKSGGRRLAREYAWTHLQSEYTFSTVASTAAYALPSDFRAMIPQTHWNRTTQWPLLGPTSPQRWQYLQALTGNVIYAEFRSLGGQIKLTPTPSATQSIAFEYLSSYWVKPTGQTAPTADQPTVATDTVCFDPLLAVSMLRLAFKKAKGMDTSGEQQDYDDALSKVMGEDAPAPVLQVSGGLEYHLVDGMNLPGTGWGS